jgi:hypothetical protein
VPADYLPGLLEYTDVVLVAGYQRPTKHTNPNVKPTTDGTIGMEDTGPWNSGPNAPSNSPGGSLLFSGQVIWIEHGRENATDTFIRLYCNARDDVMTNAVSNITLPAGHTAQDIIGRCVVDMQAMNGSGGTIKVGQITANLSTAQSPRGRTLYGPTDAILRDVAQSADAFFHVDAMGQLHLIAAGESLPNPVITLNSQNGMVDIPHQNLNGSISVRSLLNPSIRPGILIHINEKDIRRSQHTPGTSAADPAMDVRLMMASMSISGDGYYTVWAVKHYGDTRGNPWYSEAITYGMDPTAFKPQFGGPV